MSLHAKLFEIAERDSLPTDHPIRLAAQSLLDALRQKMSGDFPDRLFEAETDALAAYAEYTGKPFIEDE
jgi:hypothetical protein